MHRSGNEDAFLVADLTTGNIGGADVTTHPLGERGSLMIVSDGMGGAAAGEIASDMAVTTIRESLEETPASVDLSESLKAAAESANGRIWNHSQNNPELSGMGATLTAVLVQGTTAYVAQVGDSRAYLIRREQIKQLTRDQSLAQMLVDSGAINADQMHSVPQNVIMQALGTQPEVKVAMTAVQLCRNDCLVICSDGLSNKVPPEELRETLGEIQDLTEACRVLIERANERGGEDNITVIIARFDGEALHAASESTSITGSFRALDQGYFSEHFSGAAGASGAASTDGLLPETEQKNVTAVMNALDVEEFETATPPAATADYDEKSGSRLAAPHPALKEGPRETTRPEHRRRGYAVILIVALISLLLLGATGFFIYSLYLKPNPLPPPQDVSQPPE
jgi:serine/threonine protein phosphatase PrpC